MSRILRFYSAPLACAVVPQLGCGCLAKPVLIRLEGEAAVERAWLHRSGEVIAVEWKRELDAGRQVDLLWAALGGQSDEIIPVPAAPVSELLASFPDPACWYGRESVDHLSEEEAHTLAARVVLRLSEAGVPLPEGAALQCDLACAFRDVLIDEEVVPIETRLDRLYVAASTVLQQHVGAQQERRWKVPLRACMHLPTC
ncbi:hypothetical protein J5H37_13415 [Stenotrophomonas maltophilia]|uniref:hypothetical protein n=1 Tax=Lysobacteraceae TaxID=32033 RepID=UPI0019D438B1|nr:hypothetical protein [Stenotrophomonas maltophilia]MBN7830499.1 hypothetical protein [Stenotrophomonas maltophilia]MBN7833532.1 hypothetical protein [Stenotrophomonas maltophilia]MBN7859602.1 hypothetical protein [Stenotrophomonas maltophilia]MBN7916372.1 hypothetical protein [Stenotrophomonas maltophilia]MBO2846717.1 hypothetical protein [Stenotrophomonas maltophilia]